VPVQDLQRLDPDPQVLDLDLQVLDPDLQVLDPDLQVHLLEWAEPVLQQLEHLLPGVEQDQGLQLLLKVDHLPGAVLHLPDLDLQVLVLLQLQVEQFIVEGPKWLQLWPDCLSVVQFLHQRRLLRVALVLPEEPRVELPELDPADQEDLYNLVLVVASGDANSTY
jgi:hypothetical protein